MPTATLTVNLPSEEIEFLQKYAQQHGLTAAEVVARYLHRLKSGAQPAIHPEVAALTGLVPPGEVPSLVGVMDSLIHLSRREGLPRALPQALAAGRPVVAYDCDGAAEVCFDQQTGFLVEPGDLPTLRDRVLRLASAPDLRAQLGANGRAFVEANFDVGNMTREIFALYERLLANRPAP